MPDQPPFLLARGLQFGYGKRPVLWVPANIRLPKHGVMLVVGRNGEGKSTLMRALAGTLPGQDRPLLPARMSMLPEFLDLPPEVGVGHVLRAMFDGEALSTGLKLLDLIGLDGRSPYASLSKGNQQKARLVLTECAAWQDRAEIVLLDEPLSGLDYAVRDRLVAAWDGEVPGVLAPALRLVSIHSGHFPAEAKGCLGVGQGAVVDVPLPAGAKWVEDILGSQSLFAGAREAAL